MQRLLKVLMFMFALTLSGCCCPGVKPAPKPAPAPEPALEPKKVIPASSCGAYMISTMNPGPTCGVVELTKDMPMEVEYNKPFNYAIKVTNLTDMTLSDVTVSEKLAKNFKFKSADPEAKESEGKISWTMEVLGPKETKAISVTGMATTTDCVTTCATVTYMIPACGSVKVVQPQLKLAKAAPAEVLLCDPIPVKIVVTNSGSGPTQNVKIVDNLPEGLKTADGRSELVFDAGTLAAGQSREFTTTLKATKTGKYVNKAVASTASGLKAEAETTTAVHQPVLTIAKTAPERLYLGRDITYDITVTNKGDAPARNLVIQDQLPSGIGFVSATNNGRFADGKVAWNIGDLPAGQSRKVSVTAKPNRAGTFSNSAMAMATCAEGVSASANTTVSGIAAVLLEVVDLEDPIAVGGTETYVITATNQGSMADTNIRIVCMLEDTQQYVSSTGPTLGRAEGNTITFAPLPTLAPGAKAAWRLVVKAVKAGDVRFTAVMNTDQLGRPVQETEATTQYE